MLLSQVWRHLGLAALVLAILLTACREPERHSRTIPPPDQIKPEALLLKLRQKYQSLKSYVDNATLVERGVSRSRGTLTEIPYSKTSLVFERPNRYAVSYEFGMSGPNGSHYRVVSDGTQVRSSATELPEQVHEAIAPRIVTPENFIPEPELRQAILGVSVENLFPQFAMILNRDNDTPIFPRATDMELLAEDSIDGSECYRLALTEPEGKRILWIDKQELILRRMELPIDNQRKQLDPGGQLKEFRIDLDIEVTEIDVELDNAAFSMNVPEGVHRVRRFIPPPPSGPIQDLGKPVKDFQFSDINGSTVTSASLKDKVAVLEFWATDCAPCKQHTPVLEAAYQQLKEDSGVAFFGVSTDPEGLATSSIVKTLQSWGGTFPLLRDLEKDGYYSLKVKVTPTLLLLDPKGQLQAFHIGLVNSAEELVDKVRRLQNGEDLAQEADDEYARELEEYEAIFRAAIIEDSPAPAKSEPAEILPRKLPEVLKADEIWHSEPADLKEPGGVALVAGEDSSIDEILVIDTNNAIVRFGFEGKLIGRTTLEVPAESDRTFVRAATGNDENWYLISGVGWQRVHVFDRNWKKVLSFPDETHCGIGDAQLIDLDANGVPSILVGYWGSRGVQIGTPDGQRGWTNRHLDHVLQVAAGPVLDSGQHSVWCTSTRGTVFEISADGKLQREFPVVGHTIIRLEPGMAGEASQRCGISVSSTSQLSLVCFDREGEVIWSYDLPAGDYPDQVPEIQRIDLPEHKGCLIVTGPDGSIRFISTEGKLIDRFDYGQKINGLAAATLADGTFLWVSAGNRLSAWRITANQAP